MKLCGSPNALGLFKRLRSCLIWRFVFFHLPPTCDSSPQRPAPEGEAPAEAPTRSSSRKRKVCLRRRRYRYTLLPHQSHSAAVGLPRCLPHNAGVTARSRLICSLIPLDWNLIASEHIHPRCAASIVRSISCVAPVLPQHLVESEPVKRSKRSSAEAASGKIKVSRAERRSVIVSP